MELANKHELITWMVMVFAVFALSSCCDDDEFDDE